MSAHTPGPWNVKADQSEANHFAVVLPKGGLQGDAIIAHCRCEANARLMAAAPDLLNVLKDIKESGLLCLHSTNQGTGETFHTEICAAIAKAEAA